MPASLSDIEAMVAALPAADQARLLRLLVSRVTDAALVVPTNGQGASASQAWRDFRLVGQRLAASAPHPSDQSASLTRAVTDSRR